jgi:hypothetical protein
MYEFTYSQVEDIRRIVKNELDNQKFFDNISNLLNSITFDSKIKEHMERKFPIIGDEWCRKHLADKVQFVINDAFSNAFNRFVNNSEAVRNLTNRLLLDVDNQVRESGKKVLADIVANNEHGPVMTALSNELKRQNQISIDNEINRLKLKEKELDNVKNINNLLLLQNESLNFKMNQMYQTLNITSFTTFLTTVGLIGLTGYIYFK